MQIEGPGPYLPIPLPHIRQCVRRHLERVWTTRFLEDWYPPDPSTGRMERPKYRQTKLFFPEVNRSQSKRLLRLGKVDFSRCVRYITGFNWLRRCRRIIEPEDTPTDECRLCEMEEESSYHIVAVCPALVGPRMRCLGDWQLNDPPVWTPEALSRFLREPRIAHLEEDEGTIT